MQIFINNQIAAIKQGSSFDYVAENRLFSGADSYTLAITFPLKDCPQNQAIFGFINRKDVAVNTILFDCEIRDKAFVKYGSVTITEINESEVKCQFLEGRSVQNFEVTFDEIYINELELGYPDTSRDLMTCDYPYSHDSSDGQGYLALPWVNNNTGNIQNKWKAHHTLWADRVHGLSFQPYMWYLLDLIFAEVGYSWDSTPLRNHTKWGYLLCCNTVPYAWGIRNWARALPHWTLTEFLEQLELLMECEFDIDHSAHSVTISWSYNKVVSSGLVVIDNVVNEFSAVPTEAEQCKYQGQQARKYSDCSHRMWKYMSCPAVVKKMQSLASTYQHEFNTVALMVSANGLQKFKNGTQDVNEFGFNRLYHAKDVDMYWSLRVLKREYTWHEDLGLYTYYWWAAWQAINQFGPTNPDASGAQEVKIVPCWLDEVINERKGVKRLMLFLDCPDMEIDDGMNDDDESTFDPEANKEYMMNEFNSYPCYYASHSESEKQEFFDKIYVGFWKKNANGSYSFTDGDQNDFTHWPFPVRDKVEIDLDWTVYRNNLLSLRFNHDAVSTAAQARKIDPTRKYTFKWLSDDIPNPRAVFLIQGRKYVCEQITATFTDDGMSQLLKGNFYLLDVPDMNELPHVDLL